MQPLRLLCAVLLAGSSQASLSGNFGMPGSPSAVAPNERSHDVPRCPEYQSLAASAWSRTTAGDHLIKVTTPGITASQRRISVADDGGALRIQAFRPLHLLGGRACLPRTAHISGEGRHELLEGRLDFPPGADVSGATVRSVQGGVEITVASSRKRHEGVRLRGSSEQEHASERRVRGRHSQEDLEASKRLGQATVEQEPSLPPQPSPRDLALAQGVEILDEEYLWPAKNPDAATGWYDTRGDFHEY